MPKTSIVIFRLTPEFKKKLGISGSDIRFINIFKKIPKNKISLTLVGTKTLVPILNKNKIIFNYLPIKSKTKVNNLISLCLFSLINIFKSFKSIKINPCSTIYSTSDLFWETIPAFFYRHKVKKWIQIIHHVYPDWKKRPGNLIVSFFGFYFQKFSFFLIRKKADTIIVVNPLVKEQLIKLGFNPQKIFLSSNGINLKHHQIDKKKYDAVFLGRLDPSKGLNDLVPIWSRVCQKNPKAKLVLVGGGQSQNLIQLKKEIDQTKLDKNIKIFGFVNENQKEKILAQSKLFILPSHEEGWGISIAEAMSFRLPIICWQLGNLKQIFKNHLLYIPIFNYQSFSDQIIDLLKRPKLIRSFGTINQKFVQQFSWDKVSKQELKIILS